MIGLGGSKHIRQRLASLERHLRTENPLLVDAVRSFRKLDRVAYNMGLLDRDQSYATQIPWWPLISVLGTFSAGKSSFINQYLSYTLQTTGTQAVDDKFTVICYGGDDQTRELPGIALDSDPRFPFYQMNEELEKVEPGQGDHVDRYLRLKTCPAERLKGQILIDSPGFDADAQRNATLRITDYIIDLSDLVLVFFDARHPEPGAMQDTLSHLVANAIRRRDSTKFLYILNQIDATAREDNPEDVVSSWQRALAQEGLTAGRFYCIYNPEFANPIEDDALRERFESKRDHDLAEIHQRMERVGVERAYRVMAALEKTTREIEEERMPRLRKLIKRWARGVWWRDGVGLAVVLALLGGASALAGYWEGGSFHTPAWLSKLFDTPQGMLYTGVVVLLLAMWGHYASRKRSAAAVQRWVDHHIDEAREREEISRGFARSTRPWRSVFDRKPAGWNRRSRRRLSQVMEEADGYIQTLNDRYTNPSGAAEAEPGPRLEAEAPPAAETEAERAEPGVEATPPEHEPEREPEYDQQEQRKAGSTWSS